jgi:apolipoprotein N-acyltransferase
MIQAVLDGSASKEEGSRVFDAALWNEDVRKRLGMPTLAEEAEQQYRLNETAVRTAAIFLFGAVFFLAGLPWLYANVTSPPLRIIGFVLTAVSAFMSARAVIRLVDRKKA